MRAVIDLVRQVAALSLMVRPRTVPGAYLPTAAEIAEFLA
jgi:hypothetical protein